MSQTPTPDDVTAALRALDDAGLEDLAERVAGMFPLRRARVVLRDLDDAALLAVASRVAEVLRVEQRRTPARTPLVKLSRRLDGIAAEVLSAIDDVDRMRGP